MKHDLYARFTLASALLLGCSLGIARPAQAQQGAIQGTVRDAATGEPIATATVLVVGTARGSFADETGSFRIDLSAGTYTIRAALIGYEAVSRRVTVVAGETATVDFELPVGGLVADELVVIGSRTARTEFETPVPVDVISEAEIRESPHVEVNQILRELVPSYNASHQTIGDGTDHINPASLRGLGPDQTLVLINGKRRHTSSVVHVNGTFGRGTVGVDLNSIPPAAIQRIEVLRDGAAAQYGSDAIAGVINIVLKDQTESLQATIMGGVTGEGDGAEGFVDANFGFPIGDRGFFNVTAEFLNRERTNRSEPEERDLFPGISGTEATDAELAARGLTREDFSMKTGQAKAQFGAGFFNMVVPISESAEVYSFGGITHRKGRATGFYRRPIQEDRTVLEIFPNGFLPQINPDIDDASIAAGVRGSRGGWDLDGSIAFGTNSWRWNIENTLNASQGAASSTTFDAGRYVFSETVGNVDAVKLIDTKGALESLSLVLGAEFRVERFEEEAGEPASFLLGNGGDIPGVDFDTTSAGDPKDAGSQVFFGRTPENEVDRFRNSFAGYVGLESQITDKWLLDLSGRFETFSDFGSTFNGKIATRIEIVPEFALRGALSTGFRAPSLHQIWFSDVSIQFVTDPETNELAAARVLTARNQDPVTKAFGIPDLKEETSINVSGGFVWRPIQDLSITTDVYFIAIDDRIVLTSRFSTSDSEIGDIIGDILEPFERAGVSQAQFFSNIVDTETFGIDIVATYAAQLGGGVLSLTGAASFTDTDVTAVNIPPEVADVFTGGDLDAVRDVLFSREERNRLEDALPRQKGLLQASYGYNRFSVTGRANYYGNVQYKPSNPDNDEDFSAKTLFDLDLGYEIVRGVRLSVGANNIFNTFPDEHEKASNRSGGRFPFSRRVTQFGMNGGFYYGRIQMNL